MDNVVKERLNWLRHQIDYYGRYHDHKETMAWVATAFYLGGVIYLSFNLNSLLHYIAAPIVFTIIFLFVLPIPIYIFLNMQFNRRWEANEKVKIFREEMKRLLDSTPEQLEAEPDGFKELGYTWTKFLDCRIKKEKTHRWKAWAKFLSGDGCSEDHYPLKSEFATYLAIFFVTILAVVLIWVQYVSS